MLSLVPGKEKKIPFRREGKRQDGNEVYDKCSVRMILLRRKKKEKKAHRVAMKFTIDMGGSHLRKLALSASCGKMSRSRKGKGGHIQSKFDCPWRGQGGLNFQGKTLKVSFRLEILDIPETREGEKVFLCCKTTESPRRNLS